MSALTVFIGKLEQACQGTKVHAILVNTHVGAAYKERLFIYREMPELAKAVRNYSVNGKWGPDVVHFYSAEHDVGEFSSPVDLLNALRAKAKQAQPEKH
jgi:hypothetical protein